MTSSGIKTATFRLVAVSQPTTLTLAPPKVLFIYLLIYYYYYYYYYY
jgi:hypothetical protein